MVLIRQRLKQAVQCAVLVEGFKILFIKILKLKCKTLFSLNYGKLE